MLYIIVSSSKCKYQEWQLRLLDWSRRRVGQQGRMIILISEDLAHQNESPQFVFGTDVEVIELPDWAHRWKEEHDDWWGGIPNKYESFNWIAKYYPFKDDDQLLFLDPDMIFLKKVNLDPGINQIIAQQWIGYRSLKNWPQKEQAFMYPFALRFSTLKLIREDFKNYCFRIRKEIGAWESDMWALDYAADSNGVQVEYIDRLGVCTPWKENDLHPPSPIIHFPNVVESKKGKKLFFKQDYTFQPDQEIKIHEARNSTDRQLLINIAQERTDYIYHVKWDFQDIFKRYHGESGTLILKPWPGGFNNIRMSLELSVCLAYLTNRTLVLPSAYHMYLLEGQSSFEDFFELSQLGIKVQSFETFCELHGIEATEAKVRELAKIVDYDGVANVLNFEKMLVPKWFSKGRNVLNAHEVFVEAQHIFLDGKLLGAFYQSIYTSFDEELKKLVAKHVVYRNDIFDLAWEHINYIGDQTYYAIHIRRNDFQYKELFISCEEILNNLKDIVPRYATLYIATDHKELAFFNPLKDYYRIVFYHDIASRLKRSPENINCIPIIEQLICSRALKFVGMKLSTLSSYIYRLRGYMADIEDKQYYLNGEPFSETKQLDFKQDLSFMANWAREYKCSWNFNKPHIFVSIASYCDTQLDLTIQDAIEGAADISRVIFGVHLQDTEETRRKLQASNYPNLRIKFTPKELSKGVLWARNCIKRELYQDEDYFLQIDAHTRFKKNWDNILVNQYQSLEDPKAIITTYPNAFEISDQDKTYLQVKNNSPLIIRKFLTDHWEENRLRPGNEPPLKDYEKKACAWCAAGFVFAPGRWVRDIVLPDEIIFNGEEDLMTYLSYFKGYNLLTPSEACIWHNYNFKNEKTGERYKEFNQNLKGDDSMHIVNDRLFGYTYTRSLEDLQKFLHWNFRYLEGHARTFVCIAAYLDADIRNTIENCFQNAKYPDKIRLGICWQYDNATTLHKEFLDDLIQKYPLQILKIPFSESKGVGWARKKAMQFYQNEKYCLQIDAHTRFVQNWDDIIIENYRRLKTIAEKPLISCLPPAFSVVNERDLHFENKYRMDIVHIPEVAGITNEYLLDYHHHTAYATENQSNTIPTLEPCFIFSEGHWAKNVFPTEKVYYLGEDVATTLRSYMQGYDFFAPEQNVVWHGASGSDTLKHYNTHNLQTVHHLNDRSMHYLRDLVEFTDNSDGPRTIRDYEKFANVDFQNLQVHPFERKSYALQIKPYKLGLITRCKEEYFVEEFCNYYLSQGVDKIHIIDDNSRDKSIYDHVENNHRIVIHFEKDIFERSFPNQLYLQIKDQFEWMIHVDMDEFITTKKFKERTIRQMLEREFKDVHCIKVPWVMMSSNGQKESPNSILKEITHRWDHDKRHPNEITDHNKFRCRYDKIEVKSIFKPSMFRNMWEHHPGVPKDPNPVIVDGISGQSSSLDSFYGDLREEDIRTGFLLCYHYRIISEEQSKHKLATSGLYKNTHTLEEVLSNDYAEVLDETLKTKTLKRSALHNFEQG